MRSGPVVVALLCLAAFITTACSSGLRAGSNGSPAPGQASNTTALAVTLRQFNDLRPDQDSLLVSVTFVNSSGIFPRTSKFADLSCVFRDADGNVVGYKYCGTGGLLPNESLDRELEVSTLSVAPVKQFLVLDGETWETLAAFDISTGSPLSSISTQAESVYVNETYQGKRFASAAEWNQKVVEWEAIRPPVPGPVMGARGAAVAEELSKWLNQDQQVRNDKWKHCVLGAEIAAATNVGTARYAGWLKEYRDLTDGESGTSFNELDYQATVDGAKQVDRLSVQLSPPPIAPILGNGGPALHCPACLQTCEQRWGGRSRSWDGTSPLP